MRKLKNKYKAPKINKINLDNEISLVLNSYNDPMGDPTDWSYKSPYNFNNAIPLKA